MQAPQTLRCVLKDVTLEVSVDEIVAFLRSPEAMGLRSLLRATLRPFGELSAEAKAARMPLPPEELVGALNDSIHKSIGKARAAKTIRAKTMRVSKPVQAEFLFEAEVSGDLPENDVGC